MLRHGRKSRRSCVRSMPHRNRSSNAPRGSSTTKKSLRARVLTAADRQSRQASRKRAAEAAAKAQPSTASNALNQDLSAGAGVSLAARSISLISAALAIWKVSSVVVSAVVSAFSPSVDAAGTDGRRHPSFRLHPNALLALRDGIVLVARHRPIIVTAGKGAAWCCAAREGSGRWCSALHRTPKGLRLGGRLRMGD